MNNLNKNTLEDVSRNYDGLGKWSILTTYRGSIAHNMWIPNTDPNSIDDKDVMALCIPDINCYFGFSEYGSRGTEEIKDGEWDIVIYEARKAIKMLADGNPNILSILWLEKDHYLNVHLCGQMLLDNRHLFVGKHIYKKYTAYAYSQQKDMSRMYKDGYNGQKRRELTLKYGYDPKSAAHSVRLLRMVSEFLIDGYMSVYRKDSEELLEIKRGLWSIEQIEKELKRLFVLAEESYNTSKLPNTSDYESINRLCVEIMRKKFE